MASESSCGSGCNCGSGGTCGCASTGASHGAGGSSHSRRICQIHGLVGLYLCGFVLLHLGLNALAVRPNLYASVLSELHGKRVNVLSMVLVFLPLAVQVATGLTRIGRGGFRGRCQHGPLPSWVQRVSGLVLLSFLGIHVILAKVVARFDPGRALASAASLVIAPTGKFAVNCGVALLAVAAIWAVAVHIGNGAVSAVRFVISRPVTQVNVAWRLLCGAVGLVVLSTGLCAWTALLIRTQVAPSAPIAEIRLHER